MYTINAEYQTKNQQLIDLHSDTENLLRSTDIGTIFLDAQGRIRKYTPAVTAIIPIQPQDIGRPLNHFVTTLDIPQDTLVELFQQVYRDQTPQTRNVQSTTGTEFLMRIHPFVTTTQEVEGTVVTFVDITEQSEMQAQLQHYMEGSKALEQFAHVASHDLKAPLRAIYHLAKWIGEDDADGLSNASRKDLQQVQQRVESMETLLENLLQQSILHKQPIAAERIDSGAMVADLMLILDLPPQASIEVTPDMPTLDAPKAPFMLVFRNMLSYAIKSRPRPDCRFTISGEVSEDAAVFTVSDDSADQALNDRERLALLSGASAAFDAAVNQDMGMAFARRTAELYGGSLQLSLAPGKERALILTWPRRAAS